MPNAILTLNAGSSSLKFAAYDLGEDTPALVLKGAVQGIGAEPHVSVRHADGAPMSARIAVKQDATHEDIVGDLLAWIDGQIGAERLVAAGHRIVHGGRRFRDPVRIDATVLDAIDALTPLAPLHQPHSLSPIRAIAALRPGLLQVGCFDTAFHHTIETTATRVALPRRFEEDGVRRYGFHGLSYEFVAARLRDTAPELARGRVIVAHLGNGASLCAMRDGCSVDTTMGFTALDGLVMGTRCGAIDPGVLLYLQQQHGLSVEELQDLLYTQSGLLGVSGLSSDMQALLGSDDPHARDAIDLFIFRLAREAGALVSALGGLDGFVFTGGIGEHAAPVRAMAGEKLAWLGLAVDAEANAAHASRINPAGSRVEVLVMPTDEEAVIARHTAAVLLGGSEP